VIVLVALFVSTIVDVVTPGPAAWPARVAVRHHVAALLENPAKILSHLT
jgi:hypothetical protein